MNTQNPSLNQRPHWKVLKNLHRHTNPRRRAYPIKLLPAGLNMRRVLTEPASTFILESISGVNRLVFMIPTDQVDLVGVLALEGEQKGNNFQAVCATVNIISQEQIVDRVNVANNVNIVGQLILVPPVFFHRTLVAPKQPHQIIKLAMDIAVDCAFLPPLSTPTITFHGCAELRNHGLGLHNLQSH